MRSSCSGPIAIPDLPPAVVKFAWSVVSRTPRQLQYQKGRQVCRSVPLRLPTYGCGQCNLFRPCNRPSNENEGLIRQLDRDLTDLLGEEAVEAGTLFQRLDAGILMVGVRL